MTFFLIFNNVLFIILSCFLSWNLTKEAQRGRVDRAATKRFVGLLGLRSDILERELERVKKERDDSYKVIELLIEDHTKQMKNAEFCIQMILDEEKM